MEGVGMVKNGPNPEAAKRFVDFVGRKDTRELILAKTFRRPARQDLDLAHMPGGMPPLSSIRMADYDEKGWTEIREATMERIKSIILKTR
jgi:iron(III) transport system substrate-binding protein